MRLISEGEHAFVKHYLLDFGSTLGSAGVYPREPFEGVEYLVDGKRAMAGIPTLGFYVSSWRTMPMLPRRGRPEHFPLTIPNGIPINGSRAFPMRPLFARARTTNSGQLGSSRRCRPR